MSARRTSGKRAISSPAALAGEDAEEIEFGSVGELYGLIESGFRNIDEKELFIGSPTQQMIHHLVHFPDLIPVVDRPSAIKAIEEITEQGEGTHRDRLDMKITGHRTRSVFERYNITDGPIPGNLPQSRSVSGSGTKRSGTNYVTKARERKLKGGG